MRTLSTLKTFIRLSGPIFILLLLLCASGCSSKEQNLVGVWNNTNVPETLEFRADKTGTIISVHQPPLGFTWQKSGESKYALNIVYSGQQTVLNGYIQDSTFVLQRGVEKETYRKTP
jgi:hypothetical protein